MDQYVLNIKDKEILDLISLYDEKIREKVLLKALKIGLIALKDIETVGNVDYVEKEFSKFKNDLEKEFLVLKEDFEKKLKEADELIKEKLKTNFDPEIGIMPQVLKQYLGEGGKLSDLFDEKNNTSAIAKIKDILSSYFDDEASTVVQLLNPDNPKSPLNQFKKEITERLFAIEKEIKAKEASLEAAKKEAEKGTQKGFAFEELVFKEIEKIARILGDNCYPTGKAQGLILDSKLGDVVVEINPSQTGGATLKIVFEAKDKMIYQNELLEELEEAMKNRGALAAIAVLSSKNILKDITKEAIGVFRDYSKNRTICVLDKEIFDPLALEIAYKLARTKLLLGLKAKEMKSDSINIVAINTLIEEIIKKLDDFSTIKGSLTKATRAINDSQTQIDRLKDDILEKLNELLEKTKVKK